MSLDTLEALWRQTELDAKDSRSRLKIIGSLPQTRLVKALYANAEALIVGCRTVASVVEHMDAIHNHIGLILDDVEAQAEAGRGPSTAELRLRIAELFKGDAPAGDKPEPVVLRIVR